MNRDVDRIFALLPSIYKTRDVSQGGPLRALFAVMTEQAGLLEENIAQLYADQFIETCAPWAIPYLGDLIGYNSIYEIVSASFDSRAEIANTIGYRRRKGTAIALEQMTRDVSGRAAHVVEEFHNLILTTSMRHVEPHRCATVDLRDTAELLLLGTAFDCEKRTIDVRRIAPRNRVPADPDTAPFDIALHGPGRYNIPNVAVHLWRLRSWPVESAPAFPLGTGRYLFSPLGHEMPLFLYPRVRASFSALTTPQDVPRPIGRYEFDRSLQPGYDGEAVFYGSSESILLVADGTPVPVSQIRCANLSERRDGSNCTVASGCIAIDPESGRIAFASDVAIPRDLRVNYCYGFAAPIGGGPYDRSAALSSVEIGGGFFALVGSTGFPTLESAVAAWNVSTAGTGVIALPNFESYAIDLTGANAIVIGGGRSLCIASATPVASSSPSGILWSESCVTLSGSIEVVCAPTPGQLLLNGIWLSGQLRVGGVEATVQVVDSTLVPGLALDGGGDPVAPSDPSIIVAADGVNLVLTRTICGAVAADASGTARVEASIVDATSPYGIAYAGSDLVSAGADLHIEESTVVGKVRTRTMTLASNTIFSAALAVSDPWDAAVWSSRRQTGCVRFCSLPFASITPRRYRCLRTDAANEGAVAPHFIAAQYGEPDYLLLSGDAPVAIWRGADNGSQMGAYLTIQETEAVNNVLLRAPDYLPVCLESGLVLHPSRTRVKAGGTGVLYGSGYGGPGFGIGSDLI